MKVIEALLVITVWLALHNSLQDQAAQKNMVVCSTGVPQKNIVKSLSGVSQGEIKPVSAPESGAETEPVSAPESETETETDSEPESETETETDSEPESETETEPVSAPEIETETAPCSEQGSESETEGDSVSAAETETESGSESESENSGQMRQIYIVNIWPAYEDGVKIYDGTARVELEADVVGLPEGMELEVWGMTEKPDVGSWQVEPQFYLDGEQDQEYEIVIEAEVPEVEVVPKPLTITISDGVKKYFEEPDLKKVEFLTEEASPVCVTGFVETEEGIPEGFVPPELELNRQVLKKDSPMYENGMLIEYENAIVVKKDKEGNPTGNPTKNYCFVLDENSGFYDSGSVYLQEASLTGTLDYSIRAIPENGIYRDDGGILWVRSGTQLQMIPEDGRGFTHGTVSGPLTESGTVALQLLRKNKKEEIKASSMAQSFSFEVDKEAPFGVLVLEGKELRGDQTVYRNNTVRCGISEIWDRGSGVRSVKICVVKDSDAVGLQPQELYQSQPSLWQDSTEVSLTEEGNYALFARVEDQVGNVRYLSGGQVVLDWTKPEIEIQNVLPESANNGEVSPIVFCQDESYQDGSLEVILKGSSVGEKKFSQIREKIEYGEQIQIEDIPREKRWDDVYVLLASAVDLAGNKAEQHMAFSINRFGSVYRLDTEVEKRLTQYYMKEPVDLVLWEFNVNSVSRENIRIGHNGELKTLIRGEEYLVSEKRTMTGWKEYCYRIPAANFQEEGVYYVVLSTRDQANNSTDTQRQNLKLEFAVDRTVPSILVTGIENNKIYEEEQRTAVIECRDNLNLKNIQIFLNEELLKENEETQQRITFYADNRWQRLEIRVVDEAGNEKHMGPVEFCVGNPEEVQQETDEGTAGKAEEETKERTAVETEKVPQMITQEQEEKTEGISGEEAVMEQRKKESLQISQSAENRLQVLIFMAILCVIGGYLYKIKGVK